MDMLTSFQIHLESGLSPPSGQHPSARRSVEPGTPVVRETLSEDPMGPSSLES